jgi:hypothetical protein
MKKNPKALFQLFLPHHTKNKCMTFSNIKDLLLVGALVVLIGWVIPAYYQHQGKELQQLEELNQLQFQQQSSYNYMERIESEINNKKFIQQIRYNTIIESVADYSHSSSGSAGVNIDLLRFYNLSLPNSSSTSSNDATVSVTN